MKLFLCNQLGFGEFQVHLEWISREDRSFLTQLTADWTGLIGVQSTTASTSLCAQRSSLRPQGRGGPGVRGPLVRFDVDGPGTRRDPRWRLY